ncbi:hypothetical protein MNBD_ALPHA08-323 [hydrothermal vent metagenome]|uniref:Uncharacterized protein n=1 Tax=hydrothermal vent metagenome TaxID=652676 RepID=A0A3B0SAZ1_9ZZZZ
MITRIAITVLATAFLGAAAYAVVPGKSKTAVLIPINTTTIEKNQAFPLKGNIALDPCAKVRCQSA